MAYEKGVIRNTAVLFTVCFVALLWLLRGAPSARQLADYVAERAYTAVFCCVALFVLKGLVSFLPTAVIYLICGCLLPARWALIICLTGSAYVFTLAYFSGRREQLLPLNTCKGGFLPALFLHSIRFIPCEAAGYYLGRIGTPYFASVVGTVLGLTPSVALTLSVTDKVLLG